MNRFVAIVSVLVPVALVACNRSEELGHLRDAAVGDDAHVDGACGGLCFTPPLGTPCTSAAGCGSGYCVDGVCCNAACTGSSMTCNAAGSVGTCTAVSGSLRDAAVGDDAHVDGACGGLCFTPPLGTPCTSAAGCGSGYCVDGVCCNAACDGSCMTCSAAGSLGTCVPAASCP